VRPLYLALETDYSDEVPLMNCEIILANIQKRTTQTLVNVNENVNSFLPDLQSNAKHSVESD